MSSEGAPSPRYDLALAFLKWFAPLGLWVLTSIEPTKKRRTTTATFAAGEEEACRVWLESEGTSKNIYFHLNPTRGRLTKKADKGDMEALAWLHVDVDPRAGEELNAEQKRILGLFKDLPKGVVEPSCVTFSGGGFQGFWRLTEALPLKGDVAKCEALELYNQQLELLFGADSCHNVDRIMRLPGTINRPDEKKRKKGRVETLAEVVYQTEAAYPLSMFTPATGAPESGRPAPGGSRSTPTHVAQRVISLGELPQRLPDDCKQVMLHGTDPTNPSRFRSRSDAVWFVVCTLLRHGVTDDVVRGIITDPAWSISAHVLDQPRPERYAKRQVERAHCEVDDDPVAQVNREYFAVLEGRKIQFFRENTDGTIREMDRDAFRFELADRRVSVQGARGNVQVDYATLWQASPRRRYYRGGFVLDPSDSHPHDQYNLWRGFGVAPVAGDWHLMRDHVVSILASGNAAHADYILKYAAWTVQNPAHLPRVALAFRGEEGVGKGAFCNALVRIFGPHGQRLQNMNQIAGRFNAHLRNCCLLFADEAMQVSEEFEGTLKGMITEARLPIEAKGQDIVTAENHLHVLVATNSDAGFLPVGPGARRFAIFDVSDARKGDSAYFEALFVELESGGLEAMLYDLLRVPLGSWTPEANRPITVALTREKVTGLKPMQRVWFECLHTGYLPGGDPQDDVSVLVPTVSFVDYAKQRSMRDDLTSNKLASLFHLFEFTQRTDVRPRGWEVPGLLQARRIWDAKLFPYDWDSAETWHVGCEIKANPDEPPRGSKRDRGEKGLPF